MSFSSIAHRFGTINRNIRVKIKAAENKQKDDQVILLARPNRQRDRLQMIEQALRDKAPRMHRELLSSGQLQTFLTNHEAALMEVFEALEDDTQTRIHRTTVKHPCRP